MKKEEREEIDNIIHDLSYLIKEKRKHSVIFKTIGVLASFSLLFIVVLSLSTISAGIYNQFIILLFAISLTFCMIGIFFTLIKLIFDIFGQENK